jgi:hypothetical protein
VGGSWNQFYLGYLCCEGERDIFLKEHRGAHARNQRNRFWGSKPHRKSYLVISHLCIKLQIEERLMFCGLLTPHLFKGLKLIP